MENFCYQFLGGSSVVWMGFYVINVKLLRLAGVSMLFWWIKEFALDLLVLTLTSLETISKLCLLENGEQYSMEYCTSFSIIFYFLHIKL